MRKLLGTHMGYSAIILICQMLQQEVSKHNAGLVRGGLFYINMALWSNNQVTFKISLLAVLPAIYNVREQLVIYKLVYYTQLIFVGIIM